ncbi:hypothetical protein PMSD_04965 [Paenibacillus macquariensis subsp. defensor]|nr:hypothetical protein PMSD_04965 [Paenibacillus macquariensis subsp. defensor]
MELGNEAITFLIRTILEDLDNYIEQREQSLKTPIYNNIGTWLEYVEESSPDELEIIMNEVHESISEMSVWEYDHDEQNALVGKMYQYFAEFYGTEDHIKYFSSLLVNYYRKQIKSEFKI